VIKPAGGKIKKTPIDVISINDNINKLAVKARKLKLRNKKKNRFKKTLTLDEAFTSTSSVNQLY
jgi:hypothetical protein